MRRADPSPSTRPGVIIAVVCLALATVVAAMASLNVALPDIARDTHASQTELTWVIDAYSLAFASLLLPGGGLGDRYGRRVALIVGLVIFGGGSAVAMTTTSATELIALRAILGVGGALVMPATLSTITSTFPASGRTRAVSIWSAVGGDSTLWHSSGAGFAPMHYPEDEMGPVISLAVDASQTRAVLPPEAVTMRVPSGLNAAESAPFS